MSHVVQVFLHVSICSRVHSLCVCRKQREELEERMYDFVAVIPEKAQILRDQVILKKSADEMFLKRRYKMLQDFGSCFALNARTAYTAISQPPLPTGALPHTPPSC